MKMFNKLKFNNLVISNKKGIQQSRIQTINKLVHKIRKLKALLEKHPDNAKCKERIRKSTETMEMLKKIKKVDIMKKVLLMDKPPAAIITNGLATPDEVAVALLSMNKVMQGLSKRFKTELQLDEAKKQEWQQVLMELSKRKQKIQRTEEKRQKRLELKQQKALGRKRQEWLEQNCEKPDVENKTNNTELNISTTGNWEIEELSNESQNLKEISTNTSLKRPSTEKSKKTAASNKTQKNAVEKQEKEETVTVAKIKKGDMEENVESENSEQEEEQALVVDPFFITETGENYLSTAVVKNNHNENEFKDKEHRDLHMIKLNNYDKKARDFKDRRQQSWDNNSEDFRNNVATNKNRWQKETPNKWSKNAKHNNNLTANKPQEKKEHRKKDFNFEQSQSQTLEQNLHPSWAAKQKLKPVITKFQGKKITFGENDDDNSTNQSSLAPSKNTRSVPVKANDSKQDSLHPSWVAKQKLKPTITAFQGKKITFDNDD
ncbi:hypothetical protein DOY81_001062 [Sarcophaga bullata]|nr:hypothetical protein DOY81_001062 [Sarcophaga bullata]